MQLISSNSCESKIPYFAHCVATTATTATTTSKAFSYSSDVLKVPI